MVSLPLLLAFAIAWYHLLFKIGPLFLFIALMLGIVGIPIPDELMLIGAGYLAAHQKLNILTTWICAVLGSICGITVSYFLGRLVGKWIIRKYGNTLNITKERLNLVHAWFKRVGKWLLIFGYFIPIFRHLVGFSAGGTKLNFKDFALYAYTGAIIWSTSFLGLGYFFPTFFKEWFSRSETV